MAGSYHPATLAAEVTVGLRQRWERGQVVKVVGFDDTPFDKHHDTEVDVAGMVCHDTRLEGMLWGTVGRDGTDATDALAELVTASKFASSLDLVLLDGLTVGGMNVVDLRELHRRTGLPCASAMRRAPDFDAIDHVLGRYPDGAERRAHMDAAGPVHALSGFFFQVIGAEPEVLGRVLGRLTDRGKVPEPLRLAHLVGAAVKTGQSSKRA